MLVFHTFCILNDGISIVTLLNFSYVIDVFYMLDSLNDATTIFVI